MRVYATLIAILLGLSLAAFPLQAQDATSVTVFTDGGYPFSFTSDGRYMVLVRGELPAVVNEDTWSNTFVDIYQTADFSRTATYDIPDGGAEFLALSYDAQLIAYVQSGGLYLLDRQTGAITQETANFYEFEALKFNPVNNLLAYVVGRGITVFDPAVPAIQYELLDDVYGGRISSVAWSPDGRYLAHGVYRGGETGHDVVVWDTTQLDPGINSQPSFALLGGEPVQVAWRDANTLASFGSGGVSIFDVPTRQLIVFIPNPSGLVWSGGDWSPDGTRLIASGSNQSASEPAIQIWDVSNLPAYETIFYQEGVIGGDIHWLPSGLFYTSFGGIRRDGEFLAPQLTATAQATPTFTPAPTETPTPTLTPTPAATPTPAPFQRLRLTSLCSANPAAYRLWRIRNSNPVDVVFTWDVYRSPTEQNGFGVAPPAVNGVASEVIISTVAEAGANTLRLFVDGAQQDVKASSGTACPTPTPAP
jgi:hypothetical protein